MAYSMDFRIRAVDVVRSGESIASTAQLFGVAYSTLRDWVRRQADGRLAAGKPGPTEPRKLTAEHDDAIRRIVAEEPGITAAALIEQVGVDVVDTTMLRRLWKLGLRFKKSR